MGEKLKILCVDDDEDTLFVTGLSLELDLGIAAITSKGGAAALDALARDGARVDCIMTDVNMPRMSGPELLAAVRASPANAGIPVIFLTANAREDDAHRYRALGAAGVIAKPYDPLTLASAVRRIVASA